MKKLLLLHLSAFVVLPVAAQNTHVARHDAPIIISTNMVSIHSKSYYMESSSSSSYLVGMSNGGQALFKTQVLGAYSSGKAFKLIRTSDDHLLTISHNVGGCDYFPLPQTVITKCDTLGVIIASVSLQRQITDVTQHPDGSYYMVHNYDPNFGSTNGPILFRYSSATSSATQVPTTFTKINSICALQNGNLLVNGIENGTLKNAEMNTTGTIINAALTTYQITGFKIASGGLIYCIETNGSILSYSTNLTLLNNSGVATFPNIKITDFALRNDSVFCTGYETIDQKPYYGLLGSNLNILYQTQASYKNTCPTGISLTNLNRVSILTYGNSNANTEMKYFGLYQTSTTGSLVSRYDVGVIGYNFTTLTFPGVNYMIFKYMASANLAVKVKNFGTDTVTSFYLNYEGAIGCLSPYHQKFNVTIYPNSVVTLTTGLIDVPLSLGSYDQNGITYNANVCVSSSVPNSENDIATDNDSWCQTLTFLDPVGIKENMLTDVSVRLFPNPAERMLHVTSDYPIKKTEVVTVTGAVVYSEYHNKYEVQLETDKWPAGIYFVKTETEKGSSVRKVVKE